MEPCEITFGATAMWQDMYQWISETLGGTATPKTLWIVEANYNGQPQEAIQLSDAELAKLVFPAADSSDTHGTATISATLRASTAQHPYPCCGLYSGNVPAASNTLVARPAYFEFELGSLPTDHVTNVSSLEVTLDAAGGVHFGNIEVTVPVSYTEPVGAMVQAVRDPGQRHAQHQEVGESHL